MRSDCIFCKISKKTTSDHSDRVFFDDAEFLGMLVSNPATIGHFIVFPKKHFSTIHQIGRKQVKNLFGKVYDLAESVSKKLKSKGYVIKLNNKVYLLEKDSQHIGHIHVHVIPRYSKNDNLTQKPTKENIKSLRSLKNKILLK